MGKTTQQGIAALKSGDKSRARALLRQAVEENPDDVKAWLWLSGAVESDRERVVCLRRVLQLEPDNAAAARGLDRLTSEGAASPQAEEEQVPEPEETEHKPTDLPSPTPPSVRSDAAANARSFTVRPSVLPVLLRGLIVLVGLVALFAFLKAGLSTGDSSGAGFLNFVLLFLAAAIGFRLFILLLRRLFTRYTLTSEHLIVERGILSRSRKTIPIHRIQDVATEQSLIERPFGIGDVVVESAGERGGATLDDLPRCVEYTTVILKAVEEQEATSRGLS